MNCLHFFLYSKITLYNNMHCTHGDKMKYWSNFIKHTLHWPNKPEYMVIKRMEFIIYINNNTKKLMAESRGAAHNFTILYTLFTYVVLILYSHSYQTFDTNIGSIDTHTHRLMNCCQIIIFTILKIYYSELNWIQ